MQLNGAVNEVRANKKWRAEYMHTLVHEQDIRDEGIAIGRESVIRRMLQKDYSDSEIMEIAACSQELIDKVRSESKNS